MAVDSLAHHIMDKAFTQEVSVEAIQVIIREGLEEDMEEDTEEVFVEEDLVASVAVFSVRIKISPVDSHLKQLNAILLISWIVLFAG